VVKKVVPGKKADCVAKKQSAVSVKAASAKPVAAKAAAAPQTTITLKQIGAQLAEANELTKEQVGAIFSDMIDSIIKNLKKGAKVRISGIGILQVKKRAVRTGRNPATGRA
jgi:DNA-binding protein HU-beta